MVQSNTRMVSMSAPEQTVADGQSVDQALITSEEARLAPMPEWQQLTDLNKADD